jgi:nucleoside-diphosphate-sugar epimerase
MRSSCTWDVLGSGARTHTANHRTMVGSKILVLGATGPAGINVLRELVHRKQGAMVFARTPGKIPTDLSQSSYIEVGRAHQSPVFDMLTLGQIIQGEFSTADEPALSSAMSQCRSVISLLGPNLSSLRGLTPTTFADMYEKHIFPAMRQHSVRRIFTMSTISVYRPADQPSFGRWATQFIVWLVMGTGQKNMFTVQELLDDAVRAKDIDWTNYRLPFIPGGSDGRSWRKDREGDAYDGPIRGEGWSMRINRALLAKWLVDSAIDGRIDLVHRSPAVSRRIGGHDKNM